jgi:N-acetylneuraminate lyase
MKKIDGLIAAPFTGMNTDGSINYEMIAPYAEYLISSGLAGVFINGTTGEGLSLTIEERIAIAEEWIKYNSNDFKVIVHVGSAGVADCKTLAAHSKQIGAEAIGMQGPCFFRPDTVEGLVDICSDVSLSAPGVPFYYYHMPSMTGNMFNMRDFLAAAQGRMPDLAGIKFTSEDIMDFQLCKTLFENRYDMLFGRDELLLCGLVLGAKGAVGSTYNFMSEIYISIIDLFKAGQIEQARCLQETSMHIINTMFKYGHPITCGKLLMKKHGLDLGPCRKPFVMPDASSEAELLIDVTNMLDSAITKYNV